MVISAGIAFAISIVLTPIVIALCKKYNWYDEVDPRKMHKGAIPRLGGFCVFVAFFIAVAIYAYFFVPQNYCSVLPIFCAGVIIFLAGVIDDFLNLRARLKFVIQIIAALIVSCGPLYSTQILGFTFPPLLGRVFTFCWIIGLVNAYNLIDGLDWLCGGISFLTLLTIGGLLLWYQQAIGNVYLILCAALLGFLIYNKPPAKIFLGDGGSQTLGYFIAVAPLFATQASQFEATKLIVMLLLVAIPVTDVIAAMWRRKRDHRSFFSADRAHIHHKLINIGFSKGAAIFSLLFFQLIICLCAFGTIFLQGRKGKFILLFVSFSFVWLFFIAIHYINRSVNLKFAGHLDSAPQEEH